MTNIVNLIFIWNFHHQIGYLSSCIILWWYWIADNSDVNRDICGKISDGLIEKTQQKKLSYESIL